MLCDTEATAAVVAARVAVVTLLKPLEHDGVPALVVHYGIRAAWVRRTALRSAHIVARAKGGGKAMINVIVGIITAIAVGFLLVWIWRPSFRKWIEMPKYKMLREEKRFSAARRRNRE